ncbi:unnamed protein product, partial [Prorocentrum cordatum]
PVRRRQRRGTGAGVRRLRRMELARLAEGAQEVPWEAARAPARLLRAEAVHGMPSSGGEEDAALLSNEGSPLGRNESAGGSAGDADVDAVKHELAERKRRQREAMGKDEQEEALWMEIAKD